MILSLALVNAATCAGQHHLRPITPHSDVEGADELWQWSRDHQQAARMQALIDSAQHPIVRDINDDPTMLELLRREKAP